MKLLDPTHEENAPSFSLAPRLDALDGKIVGVISNGKAGTHEFFAALERELVERYGVARVEQTIKGNFSAPAEPDLLDRAREWNALVSGIGD